MYVYARSLAAFLSLSLSLSLSLNPKLSCACVRWQREAGWGRDEERGRHGLSAHGHGTSSGITWLDMMCVLASEQACVRTCAPAQHVARTHGV